MSDGKQATAPCGHPGEHVIGQYIQCPTCDKTATPEPVDDEPYATKRLCLHCGSDDIQAWPGMWATGGTLYYCNSCNATFR